MALHTRWVDGALEFYDGGLKNFKIRPSSGAICFGSTGVGCLAKAYYAGSTGAAGTGVSSSGARLMTAGTASITVIKGIVTAYTT